MTVYLNGEFLPIEEAHISPLDRGFLFGDGVYEVIPAYAGLLFRAEQHLQRLNNSLKSIRMTNPYSQDEWLDILQRLMSYQPYNNHTIYLQVTRGADDNRNHAIPPNLSPTVFIMSSELNTSPVATEHPGACALTRIDNRWEHCDVKAITLLANILLRQQAIDHDCAETLLIRDGNVIEGSASNIFVIRDKEIITPPKSPMLLPGVTRDLVLEIAAINSIPFNERNISVDELMTADEVWFTSSTKEIVPITRIDDQLIGNGEPGAVWKRMIVLYGECKQQLVAGNDC